MFKLQKRVKWWVIVGLVAGVVCLGSANPGIGEASPLLATSPTLGGATSYAVLGGSIVTNTGPTVVIGDLGISPSIGVPPHYTNFPPGTVISPPFAIHDADAHAGLAQSGNTAAFGALSAGANAACTVDYGAITKDLVGLTLVPGVYCADAFALSGTLTLNDTAASNGVWIFRTALSTLNTSAGVGARVQFLTGVGSPCNVWWKVASSASIGSGTSFIGNILALTSISMGTSANLEGRVLAQTGAITLDSNRINITGCTGMASAVGVSKSFSAASITAGSVSRLTITFSNTSSTIATLTSSFTDNLPSGMVIAGTPNVATTCGGAGALTAGAGTGFVQMAAGRTIPAGGSCTLAVNVTTPAAGSYVNTIPSGALVTSIGNSTAATSGTLIAGAGAGAGPSEVPEADTLLLFGGGIGGVATWLGWQWRRVRARSKPA